MLHSFIVGKGTPTVWLHGLLGNGLNFSNFANDLEGKHYLVDVRNHGRSFHDKSMSYPVLAEDLIRFLDNHSVTKCRVVGHSMGAKIAGYSACKYPERFEKVCLLDLAPIDYRKAESSNTAEQVLQFMKEVNLRQDRLNIEKQAQMVFGNPNIVALICSNLRAINPNKYKWRVNVDELLQGLESVSSWPQFEDKYEGPVLAICGGNSDYTCKSPQFNEEHTLKQAFLKHFPNTELKVIEEAGHFLHVTYPLEVRTALHKFLNNK